MSKCRYDLSEDCHNKDCLACVLDKIRAEIKALNPLNYVYLSSYDGHRGASDMKDDVLNIIDKYKAESEGEEAIAFGKRVIDLGFKEETQTFCELAIEALEQEPKTGQWIDNKARKDLCNCSECGSLSKAYSKYCPNCGAKME